MLCFFAMGFVDLVGIASNYVKADLDLTDSQANIKCLLKFHILLFVLRLCRDSSLCFFLVSLILQDFFDRLFLGRLFAFFCAGGGFPYPVANVPQLLQILLYLGQWYFQLCDFFQKRFLLLLQLLLGTVLIIWVLGKVG